MQTWTYPARFDDHGEDGFVVSFPDFPQAVTGAATKDAALIEAIDALGVTVREYLAQGASIPPPHGGEQGQVAVPLDPLTAARAALATAMHSQRLSKVAVAQRMRKSEGQVRRILDGHGGVRMEGVLEALRAVGVHPTLAIN